MVKLSDKETFLGGGTGKLCHVYDEDKEQIYPIGDGHLDLERPTCGMIVGANGTRSMVVFEDLVKCRIIGFDAVDQDVNYRQVKIWVFSQRN